MRLAKNIEVFVRVFLFKIKEYVKHGEAGSAEINKPDAIQQMEIVRTLAAEYGADNTLRLCFLQ